MEAILLTRLENSRNYTIGVAEIMPESKYDFKPTPEVWSFKELLHHIAYGIQWWQENYVNGMETPWDPPTTKSSKKEVIGFLIQAFDSLKATMKSRSLTADQVKGFYATLDHITHHRGQAVTYLRCNSINPPAYIY